LFNGWFWGKPHYFRKHPYVFGLGHFQCPGFSHIFQSDFSSRKTLQLGGFCFSPRPCWISQCLYVSWCCGSTVSTTGEMGIFFRNPGSLGWGEKWDQLTAGDWKFKLVNVVSSTLLETMISIPRHFWRWFYWFSFSQGGIFSSLEGAVRFVECSIKIEGKRLWGNLGVGNFWRQNNFLVNKNSPSIHRGTRFLYIYEPVWSQKGPKNAVFSMRTETAYIDIYCSCLIPP